MKKIYQSPVSLTVKLGTTGMMMEMSFNDENGTGRGGINEDIDAGDDALVKGHNIWDEDWD